jgi:hypothetical protein
MRRFCPIDDFVDREIYRFFSCPNGYSVNTDRNGFHGKRAGKPRCSSAQSIGPSNPSGNRHWPECFAAPSNANAAKLWLIRGDGVGSVGPLVVLVLLPLVVLLKRPSTIAEDHATV